MACAQCVDACDRIMTRVKRADGASRYASPGFFQAAKPRRLLRPRTLIYPAILLAIGAALCQLRRRSGAPSSHPAARQRSVRCDSGDQIVNQIRLKIENRGSSGERYHLALEGAEGVRLIAPENPLVVPAGGQRVTSVFALTAPSRFSRGELDVLARVRDDATFDLTLPCRLLGPVNQENSP